MVSLTALLSLDSLASGMKIITYEELVKYFSHICTAEVTNFEIMPNYQTLQTGEDLHISNTITVEGKLAGSHKGDCGTGGVFLSQYTTPVFADYDDGGT